jgi:hypothetical protein
VLPQALSRASSPEGDAGWLAQPAASAAASKAAMRIFIS